MTVFYLFRLDAYFLTIIAGIENTERVASDFSNDNKSNAIHFKVARCTESSKIQSLQMLWMDRQMDGRTDR